MSKESALQFLNTLGKNERVLELLKARDWEEEDSHEGSLFTSVYATEIHDGSRNFLNPQRLNAALFNQSPYSYLCTGCGFCFF